MGAGEYPRGDRLDGRRQDRRYPGRGVCEKAAPEDVDKELELTRSQYKNNPEVLKNLDQPEYREYISNILTNRKVIEWLKKQIVK